MKIVIFSTPQREIRANQCGDWWVNTEDTYIVFTLDSMSPKSQLAVGIHELIEAYLCNEHGVSDQEVCQFDEKYESERQAGKHGEYDEPGDDPRAPYRKEHQAATHVERAVCHALGINWDTHCR